MVAVIVPEWIAHSSEKKAKTPIYSLHAHPKLHKLATAGQDCKIKIWNTEPLLSEELEKDPEVPKLLSTLSLHNGAVLCVRWMNDHGTLLASGSDDTKIVLWELTTQGPTSGFGDLDGNVNMEVYRPYRVLMGHESDVADLAWSPDNSFLASAGFDSKIIIWDGKTFEKLKVISGHSGFVKGLTWDPVGKFLASQSDDKTVKIWRSSDWTMEEQIRAPYEHAATVSFFRRLSWSPEGSCIATANGENSGLCIAPIVNRDDWSADVFLVGHQAPVEVVSFNPVIFEMPINTQEKPKPKLGPRAYSAVCAVGSQDNSISVWWTAKARSAAVAQHIFNYSVLDICWSSDGLSLFACSYDGTVAALCFDQGEFGTPIDPEEKDRSLSKYGFHRNKTVVLESPEQLALEEESMLEQVSSKNKLSSSTIGFSSTTSQPTSSKIITPVATFSNAAKDSTTQSQKTSVTKDGKKRIQPIFLAGNSQASAPATHQIMTAKSNISQSVRLPDSLSIPVSLNVEKRKGDELFSQNSKKYGGMVGGSSEPQVQPVYVLPTWIDIKQPLNLGIPAPLPKISKTVIVSEDASNSLYLDVTQTQGGSKIVCRKEDTQVWTDQIPKVIIHVTGTSRFISTSTTDGRIYVYSPAGRRLLPILFVESALAFLESSGDYLLYITATGCLSVLNIQSEESLIDNVNIGHLLCHTIGNDGSKASISIVSASLLADGSPLITTSMEDTFTYHLKLKTWMRVANAQSLKFQIGKGVSDSLAFIEQGYGNLLTLTQIENYLSCALQLKLPKEYRYWLRLYARRLSDETALAKIEELCYLLLGPSHLGHTTKDWNPMVMESLPKRELLKEILPIFGKNRSLQRLIQSIDGALRLLQQSESIDKMFV